MNKKARVVEREEGIILATDVSDVGALRLESMKRDENDQNYKKESTPVVGKRPNGKSQLNMTKVFFGRAIYLAIVAAVVWTQPGTAKANPLNVTNFTSLGALLLTNGYYTVYTSGSNSPDLMDSSSNVLYTGVIYNQGGSFDSNIAVFAFSSITIGAGVTITPTGDNPVALLSQGSIDLAGTINASGTNGGNQGDGFVGAGGPGGGSGGVGGVGSGGSGQGPGGGGGGFGGLGNGSWGDGGSFGGQGAGWNPALTAAPTYGDLTQYLQGGSGGGASGANLFGTGAGGGGGGGAVELAGC